MSSIHAVSAWLRTLCLLKVSLVVLLAAEAMSEAQPARLPEPALLPHYSPLCDSNLVGCLTIDDFGAHAYGHLMVLPRTEHRDSAGVLPFGLSLGVFGRLSGGVSTQFAFWQQGDTSSRQLGPLRFNLTALLWPLSPLRPPLGDTADSDGGPHFAPLRYLRIGLTYEHELRVGPFEGANQLGMLADLAALRLVASKMLGPIELTASLGALYDWRGRFATGEAAAQVGFYLPFLRSLKVYVEALGRGLPGFVRPDEQSPPVDGAVTLPRQGVLGLGLSFRPQARVDLGVSVQAGFGGLAPSAVLVRFAVLSVGKSYQGRVASPVVGVAADGAAEIGARIKDYLDSLPIDPKLDRDCFIIDDDGSVLGRFGERSYNGSACEADGFRVPIGLELARPKKSKDRLCIDAALKDCLLERHGDRWLPVRRPRFNHRCEMYDSDGTFLGSIGKPTPEGGCRYPVSKSNGGYSTETVYEERPIGELFYTDADRSRVCVDPALNRCFMRAKERGTLAVEGRERDTTRFLEGGGEVLNQRWEGAKHLAGAAQDVATGKVKLTTVYEEGKQAVALAGRKTADTLSDPAKVNSLFIHATERISRAIEDFESKSPEEKRDTFMRLAGSGVVELGIGTATAGIGRIAGGASGMVNTARRVEKAGEAFAEVAGAEGAKRAARVGKKAVQQAELVADLPKTQGGTYMLVDPKTNRVMRTGRTSDFDRRILEHRRNPETEKYILKIDKKTDVYAEKRGREQIIHDEHKPPLDKINPISPKNPRRNLYLEAAKRLEEKED